MGFAVNRSQLGQSEWKEVAQRGHFVSGSVCEVEAENKTQSPVHFSPQTDPLLIPLRILPCFDLCVFFFLRPKRPMREALLCVFNVADDINVASYCVCGFGIAGNE